MIIKQITVVTPKQQSGIIKEQTKSTNPPTFYRFTALWRRQRNPRFSDIEGVQNALVNMSNKIEIPSGAILINTEKIDLDHWLLMVDSQNRKYPLAPSETSNEKINS